ncbi:hypothetical protein AB4039_03830 [Streptomyces sp. M-16]|uniref:hypothetical protein n=1 Tax=Streptomyces sp. M-16 TaxID=3233040 RepID=UPI003F95E3DE
MAQNADAPVKATLYEAAHYRGPAVTLSPDRWEEGGAAFVYSLAHLGLRRLGSLRAPVEPAESDSPLHQRLGLVTRVTVWASRPVARRLDPEERGTAWQQYSADTGDLGSWAARSAYVRVWQEREDAAATGTDPTGTDGSELPVTVVE